MKLHEKILLLPYLQNFLEKKTSEVNRANYKVLRQSKYALKRNISGYTLIELLTVISIMAILFSIGAANYREYARRRELINTALMVKGDLRLAQQYALSGKKPSVPVGNTCLTAGSLLEYYIFERNAAGDGYDIRAKCSTDATPVTLKTVDLSVKGISISTFSNTKPPQRKLFFYPRGKGVGNFNAGASTSIMTLTKSGATGVNIEVTSGGEIK